MTWAHKSSCCIVDTLEVLDLQGNNITGPIPENWGDSVSGTGFHNAWRIDLDGNELLCGAVPPGLECSMSHLNTTVGQLLLLPARYLPNCKLYIVSVFT